jgi:hypothetical protein
VGVRVTRSLVDQEGPGSLPGPFAQCDRWPPEPMMMTSKDRSLVRLNENRHGILQQTLKLSEKLGA